MRADGGKALFPCIPFSARTRRRISVRLCACLCVCVSAFLYLPALVATTTAAAEALSPARQPLLVLRLADPGALLDLLAGSAAQPFAPAELDFAGRLPGLGAEVASAADFLQALAAAGARDVWYCLLPGGGLARPVAGMGWQLPAGKETTPAGLATWLEGAGLRVGGRALSGGGGRSPAAGGQRVAVGPDDGTLRALMDGSGPERWRSELAAFMATDATTPAPALGVWANPRPLLGLASVFGDFDARGELGRLGLAVPESAEFTLRPTDRGLGFSLRLARVLPGRKEEESSPGLELLRTDEALLQLHIPSSVAFRLLPAPAWTEYLPLLNLNPDALAVRAASLVLWRGPDGDVLWLAGAFFSDAAGFQRNWEKLLAAARDLPGVADVAAGALRLRLAGREAWLRPARVEGSDGAGGAVLVAAARREDLPAAVELIKTAPGEGDVAARWRVRLDGPARAELTAAAAGLGWNRSVCTALLDAVPTREEGEIVVTGDSLAVTSGGGGAVLAALASILAR